MLASRIDIASILARALCRVLDEQSLVTEQWAVPWSFLCSKQEFDTDSVISRVKPQLNL